ncbi:GNAT family N-acetyltransferase [Sphaerisporangium sp. NPDC049002]|uniref:GNAT family N-acetyltransferase n=1 Tax=Sphaerisporangium sp. NPDC049002 TaxID=3155392 RepID=UPI0033E3A24B
MSDAARDDHAGAPRDDRAGPPRDDRVGAPSGGGRSGSTGSGIRPAVPAELPAIGELAQASLTLDATDAPQLVARLADPPEGRDRAALVTPGLDGVVFVSASATEGVGHVDLLAVRPSAQGHGTGRALVAAAEGWLRERGAREVRLAGNPPCYAWPGIDVRYTPAVCLAESLGYERYRTAWNMTADLIRYLPADRTGHLPADRTGHLPADLTGHQPGELTGRPPGGRTGASADEEMARLASAGVAVHAAPAGERSEVIAFVREHWNDAWAWEVAQATGCHYATRQGEILGFAAWGARPGWFGPMGTAEAARGLGVGGVLLRRCLEEQAVAGYSSTQIGWVGPVRFYAKAVGAHVERVFWLYRRPLA